VRVDVAFTPAALAPATLHGATALVVDVLRASTSIITALANGCAAIVPLADPEDGRRRAARAPGALVAGERHGEPLAGFDLGNSPLEFTAERVAGRTIFFTTSNGTEALLAARPAAEIGVAAFVNLTAAAGWAAAAARNVVVACAGDVGQRSLEDEICAGLLVDRLRRARPDVVLGPEAEDAAARARVYREDLTRLAEDSPWARRLSNHGRSRDLAACLTLDAFALVPVYRPKIDKVVSPYG